MHFAEHPWSNKQTHGHSWCKPRLAVGGRGFHPLGKMICSFQNDLLGIPEGLLLSDSPGGLAKDSGLGLAEEKLLLNSAPAPDVSIL